MIHSISLFQHKIIFKIIYEIRLSTFFSQNFITNFNPNPTQRRSLSDAYKANEINGK